MNRRFCATRNHIDFDNYRVVPDRPQPVGLLTVLKGCRYSLVIWLGAAGVLWVVGGWLVALAITSFFVVLCFSVSAARLAGGHTVKCSLLGGVASSLRVVSLISW